MSNQQVISKAEIQNLNKKKKNEIVDSHVFISSEEIYCPKKSA